MLPEWFYLLVVSLFGLIIGSFLNVVIYRLHTGRSLNDRSHCLSCGKSLSWYELFPLLSYVVLRGRCSGCGSFIPYRYSLVELATAGAFVLAYLKAPDNISLVLLCTLLSILIVGLVYDLYHMIIPDEVSYAAFFVALLVAALPVFYGEGWGTLIFAVSGAAAAFLFYAALWYFSEGRAFGFGDAKLALSLGTLSGLSGTLSLIILSFWVGAVITLCWMTWQKVFLNIRKPGARLKRVTMKSEIPFAPFLVIAFLLVYFAGADVPAMVERVMLAML